MALFKVDENYIKRLSVEQLRGEVHDFAGRWIALTVALQQLPEWPSAELLHVLGDFAKWPQDHDRGKLAQRTVGIETIPPVSECEGGAGVWMTMRAALLAARQ